MLFYYLKPLVLQAGRWLFTCEVWVFYIMDIVLYTLYNFIIVTFESLFYCNLCQITWFFQTILYNKIAYEQWTFANLLLYWPYPITNLYIVQFPILSPSLSIFSRTRNETSPTVLLMKSLWERFLPDGSATDSDRVPDPGWIPDIPP